MSSAGFKAAYLELLQRFEEKTGHHVINAWGPSMGATPQAVPNRLARGEPADVVIVVREALGKLAREGKVDAQSATDLAKSLIGAVVRAGAPHPDMSSDSLRRSRSLIPTAPAASSSRRCSIRSSVCRRR
jgi:molybdate transport system substrate-binding protein